MHCEILFTNTFYCLTFPKLFPFIPETLFPDTKFSEILSYLFFVLHQHILFNVQRGMIFPNLTKYVCLFHHKTIFSNAGFFYWNAFNHFTVQSSFCALHFQIPWIVNISHSSNSSRACHAERLVWPISHCCWLTFTFHHHCRNSVFYELGCINIIMIRNIIIIIIIILLFAGLHIPSKEDNFKQVMTTFRNYPSPI